jgi:hypothetical protein
MAQTNEERVRGLLDLWAEDAGIRILNDESSYNELSSEAADLLAKGVAILVTPKPGLFMTHIAPILHRRRNCSKLVQDLGLLPPDSQERLFRVLKDMEGETSSERSKRRRGQFF